jgi:hypothetical protein
MEYPCRPPLTAIPPRRSNQAPTRLLLWRNNIRDFPAKKTSQRLFPMFARPCVQLYYSFSFCSGGEEAGTAQRMKQAVQRDQAFFLVALKRPSKIESKCR